MPLLECRQSGFMGDIQFNASHRKSKIQRNYLSRLTRQLAGVLILLLIFVLLKYGNTSVTNFLQQKVKHVMMTDYMEVTQKWVSSKLPSVSKVVQNVTIKMKSNSSFKLEALPTQGTITSSFGDRTNPITKKNEFHQGIDISCKTGSEVKAIYGGVVMKADKSSSYGNEIVLDHQDGFSSLYAHLSSIKVHKGDSIAAGDVLGLSGNTGESTGPHLHFELRKNDTPVNPIAYLDEGLGK